MRRERRFDPVSKERTSAIISDKLVLEPGSLSPDAGQRSNQLFPAADTCWRRRSCPSESLSFSKIVEHYLAQAERQIGLEVDRGNNVDDRQARDVASDMPI